MKLNIKAGINKFTGDPWSSLEAPESAKIGDKYRMTEEMTVNNVLIPKGTIFTVQESNEGTVAFAEIKNTSKHSNSDAESILRKYFGELQ